MTSIPFWSLLHVKWMGLMWSQMLVMRVRTYQASCHRMKESFHTFTCPLTLLLPRSGQIYFNRHWWLIVWQRTPQLFFFILSRGLLAIGTVYYCHQLVKSLDQMREHLKYKKKSIFIISLSALSFPFNHLNSVLCMFYKNAWSISLNGLLYPLHSSLIIFPILRFWAIYSYF